MTGAAFCFALMNLVVRLASEELETMQIAFFRASFALIFMLPWAIHRGAASLRTAHLKIHIGRSIVSVFSMYCWFTAVIVLPLADAVALNFTAPLFVTIGAALILRELVGPRRWAATAVGFLGTIVVLRPGFAEVSAYSALPILAAVCIATNTLLVKRLSRHDAPGTIVLYMNLLLTPLCLVPALFVWVWPSPGIWLLGSLARFAGCLRPHPFYPGFPACRCFGDTAFRLCKTSFCGFAGVCLFCRGAERLAVGRWRDDRWRRHLHRPSRNCDGA